ncbi:protein of unknown function [Ruminococcaceae bacterium BL-6]|nr:protein of unknown function [Ruminococcaceae bacterium BL-6]
MVRMTQTAGSFYRKKSILKGIDFFCFAW